MQKVYYYNSQIHHSYQNNPYVYYIELRPLKLRKKKKSRKESVFKMYLFQYYTVDSIRLFTTRDTGYTIPETVEAFLSFKLNE